MIGSESSETELGCARIPNADSDVKWYSSQDLSVGRSAWEATTLVGNYRPAVLKIDAGRLSLHMVFGGSLPDSFELTYRFASIDVNERSALIDSLPLPLSDADVESFVLACEKMGQRINLGPDEIGNVWRPDPSMHRIWRCVWSFSIS